MERVLVGVDGSTTSRAALQWAADLAGRAGWAMSVVRVATRHDADDRAALQRELDEWSDPVRSGVPDLTTAVLEGDPPDALAEAGRDGAGLLVVGGRGSGGFARLHLGSVAHHLAHHTPLPLAIVPETGAAPVQHFVVGVDGSPGSLAATRLVAQLASRLHVDVTAVYAFEPFAEWVPASDPHGWHRMAEAEVMQWAAPVTDAGVPLKVDVDRDIHPVAALARALEADEGSVACVGTRGHGGFAGLRLGRVPLQLVHRTGAAVIIVPSDG